MASSSNRETSEKKANEETVSVETLNKPKQVTIDESKKNTQNDIRKLNNAPELSRTAVDEHELETDQLALSTSDENILIYDTTKFILFNNKLKQIKELEWKEYDPSGILTIDDLTYLSCQNSYLILTRSYIYELNIDKFEMKLIEEFSKKDKSGEHDLEFISITAHDEHIFIAYADASAITKWTWKPTLQLVNRWTKSKIVEETDQNILSIRTDGSHVGLLVKGDKIRLEVFDFNLATRIVHHLDVNNTAIMLTSLANNQWLIIDSQQNQLLFINEDNKIEKRQNKDSSPLNAGRLANDYIVVKCQKPNKLQIFKLD
ncbi:unnamed protein product [Rotaria sordida]|uniref:Uncharacterized protein n=1 Tax=Rotaria sordida TaxID=392033 RepID=A0A813XDC5_9BILA|nr:unnamed protein product [Rotaria sordida]CAF0934806.1 unnamed protein product [Rotaria sordida]CAF3617024.1 unnamed protein product [Rotaria sordida]CAF3931228.1 unnamed protein product [Rotaria sordida]